MSKPPQSLLLLAIAIAIVIVTLPDLSSPQTLNPRWLLSPNSTGSNKSHNFTSRKIGKSIGGFVAGLIAGLVAAALLSIFFRFALLVRHGSVSDREAPAIFSHWIRDAGDLAFLEAEDGVNACELIGRGGCGEIYRATLASDPTKLIAVKRIKKLRGADPSAEIAEVESRLLDKNMRQLRSEIKTVGHIRHRNLLPLLAHVPRPDCHYLVYEYMNNGSLQDVLMAVGEGHRELPWPARFRIARGIAAGLEYLHTQHRPQIIHRDLKPANILLDDNLDAKIADFGLAKAVPNAKTHVTASTVAGTPGYIAPEYLRMLRFTDKCDMYSFGVILAVLVVGKMPTDPFFQDTEEMSMVKWVHNKMAAADETVAETALDQNLVGSGCEKQMLLVLRVSCFCTREDPRSRPNSKDVACMLQQIPQDDDSSGHRLPPWGATGHVQDGE